MLSMVFLTNNAAAQFHTSASRSELGPMIGGTFYIGDMNPFMPFRKTHLAGGLMYRYNFNARTSLRANLIYGTVSGDDSDSQLAQFQERNLSFKSDVWELGAGLEFNYFPFQLGHDRYKGTGYILVELALFRMNPKTIGDNDSEVELQPLGTEGQGTSLSSRGQYSLTQLAIPIGVGAKLSLGDRASLNFEIGIRKTFTDYIDDIGSDYYVDPVILAAENGPMSANLSNRSLSGERYGTRGDSSTKDWYVFSGMMLTFRLGQPGICFQGY